MTSARNLLDMHGYRHSYATVQGLASSLYFSYHEYMTPFDVLTFMSTDMTGHYWPVIGQRPEVYENLAYLFNATYVSGSGQTPEEAEQSMLAFIRQGVPVMVALARFALAEHHRMSASIPPFMRDLLFAGHYIVVVAVDEATGMATYFDSDHSSRMEIPLSVLRRLRTEGDGADNCFMQSHNRWAVFVPGSQAPALKDQMHASLVRTLHNWKCQADRPGTQSGMPGLKMFAAALPGWTERPELPVDKLKATVFILRMASEKISGGSLGRRGFGMFVRQANEVLAARTLAEAAGIYAELTVCWADLMGLLHSRIFGEAAPRSLDVPEVRALLGRIVEHEAAGLQALEAGLRECA
jgi:hypothetical protein